MSRKIVHVVGTGTIGEPLIGLLSDFKSKLVLTLLDTVCKYEKSLKNSPNRLFIE